MRVMCKPGSVGDLGGQSPRSTRLTPPWDWTVTKSPNGAPRSGMTLASHNRGSHSLGRPARHEQAYSLIMRDPAASVNKNLSESSDRQERSSQTGNYERLHPEGRESPPVRTRKGKVDSDSLFRVFRWVPWLISDSS